MLMPHNSFLNLNLRFFIKSQIFSLKTFVLDKHNPELGTFVLDTHNPELGTFVLDKHNPELGTFEWWIFGLMLDPLFFLISRLDNACSPLVINLQS